MRRLQFLALAYTMMLSGGVAHEAPSGWKYDPLCCSNRDCAKISKHTVQITAQGYRVTLHVGEHPMVSSTVTHVVPYAEAKVSKDEDYHACLFPNQNTMRCFYAPPPGS